MISYPGGHPPKLHGDLVTHEKLTYDDSNNEVKFPDDSNLNKSGKLHIDKQYFNEMPTFEGTSLMKINCLQFNKKL